jgi:hypothetical protein
VPPHATDPIEEEAQPHTSAAAILLLMAMALAVICGLVLLALAAGG